MVMLHTSTDHDDRIMMTTSVQALTSLDRQQLFLLPPFMSHQHLKAMSANVLSIGLMLINVTAIVLQFG